MTAASRLAAIAAVALLAATLAGCGVRQGAGVTVPEPAPAESTAAPSFDAGDVLDDLDAVDDTLGEVDSSLTDAADAEQQESAD